MHSPKERELIGLQAPSGRRRALTARERPHTAATITPATASLQQMVARLKEGLSPLLGDHEATEGPGLVEGGGLAAAAPAATIGRRQGGPGGGASLNVFDTFAARRRGQGSYLAQGLPQSTEAAPIAAPRLGHHISLDQHRQDGVLGTGVRQAPISLFDLGREQSEDRCGGLVESISLVSEDEQEDQKDGSSGSRGFGCGGQRYSPDAAELAEGFHGVEHVERYGRVASASVDRAVRGLELKGFACRGASGRRAGDPPERENGREALQGRDHLLHVAGMPASAAPATKKKCFKAFAMKK